MALSGFTEVAGVSDLLLHSIHVLLVDVYEESVTLIKSILIAFPDNLALFFGTIQLDTRSCLKIGCSVQSETI